MSRDFPPLCLGGNVFGWTADRDASFAVLDAAREAGIAFVDSADVYSAWAHGGDGGQSETVLGAWMADRGARDGTIVATKVGMLPGLDDLRPATTRRALDASLERLRTDHVELYYAHRDDGGDLAEALGGFDALVRAGKATALGLSNFSAERIGEAMAICERDGLTKPVASQPEYSLMERSFEGGELNAARAAALAPAGGGAGPPPPGRQGGLLPRRPARTEGPRRA